MQRATPQPRPAIAAGDATSSFDTPPSRLRYVRAVARFAIVLLLTPPACILQALLLLSTSDAKRRFAALYWRMVCHVLGLKIRIIGAPAQRTTRPVVFVSNHSSWLDIPALGGAVQGCFVSKDDVARWPLIGTIARLGRSIFVSRNRGDMIAERDAMQARLAGGDNLILFPEGTSSDGSRVLPFHSAFFAAAYGAQKPLIQPVSVVFDRLAGLPVGKATRPVFAWYGDMSLAPHAWQVAQWRGKRVTILFHTPIDPAAYASRKALSQAVWQVVADGAATLRQNRPAEPLRDTATLPVRNAEQFSF